MKRADQSAALLMSGVIELDRAAGRLREQLYLQLREAVIDGRLAAGSALPSTRELATALGVARSTVVEAIDHLQAEGYLATQQGAASRVARLDRPLLGARRADRTATPAAELSSARWINDDPPTPVSHRAFRPGLPDIRAFPAKAWSTHLARRARQPASHDLSYADCCGVPALRVQLLQHVAQARFVQAEPAQVLVVPSAQAAFDIAARCTLDVGDVAWVEDPGYPGIRSVLRGHGARIVALPVDGEGLLPAPVTARAGPRLVYVTPSHQYPSGVTMSLNRRVALLALAQEHGAVIVEDDYDSEFQYDGLPIASLQGLDRAGCVMYVGTFSKTLAPGLHVAYLVVPRRFAALAHTIAATAGLAVPTHVQLALADFMADGGLRRHVRQMNARYAARLRRLAGQLSEHGGPHLHVPAPRGGLQLCVGLAGGAADTTVAAALRDQGIVALALSTLCHGMPLNGLVLGVGLVTLDEIAPAARRLCEVVRSLR